MNQPKFLFAGALGLVLCLPVAGQIHLQLLGTYSTNVFNASGSEISAYDAKTKRVFSSNVKNNAVDIIDISDPKSPVLMTSVSLTRYGGNPNHIDVKNDIVAVAVENSVKTNPGMVVFLDTSGTYLGSVTVGAEPDMLVFTPDGNKVLVANEAEPNDQCTIDPEGSISIIDISGGPRGLTQDNVRTADFKAFTKDNIDPRIRIVTATNTVAQDLEPEYIAVSADSKTAWVTLQEANALAIVDIDNAKVTRLVSLGFKDYSVPGNGLDPSDRDGGVNIGNWPVLGMYQPDHIAAYQAGGRTYLVTANEGDQRDWAGCNEVTRVSSLKLDPAAFPDPTIQLSANLGRLRVTKVNGDANRDGLYEKLYAFGARSFAIWNADGQMVFESGDAFERITAAAYPDNFNATHTANLSFDARSPDKGPEPEGLVVSRLGDRWYAFISLERIGGIMVYDITSPAAPKFVEYVNNRNFYLSTRGGTAGDLGPEGMLFVPAADSPNGKPMLIVSNEVSGTLSTYQIVQ